jgi:hypothetical protein
MKILRIFGHLDKTWQTLDFFIILTFISEQNRYSKHLYKSGEFISFDIIKKRTIYDRS